MRPPYLPGGFLDPALGHFQLLPRHLADWNDKPRKPAEFFAWRVDVFRTAGHTLEEAVLLVGLQLVREATGPDGLRDRGLTEDQEFDTVHACLDAVERYGHLRDHAQDQ